ncbi:hypothetical protein DBV05_g6127 [Lasiodiplodia theobromae]|uniref:Xylanolytic transcriptional activator regulatory domain-containing protein n=1 Tax=Lasiodiplodia theobromae TaxID=45133 RepID=A0A5N5DBE5_9PEZI|nr:hypothetical protein DBV05_g6127 [Lasiodiplodia theobromae]
MRYFGPSSSISILSPDGLQWLESRTSDASLRHRLEQPLRGGGSWAKWTHPLLQSLWPANTSTALPPWDEALALVTEFFDNYNTVVPIFHPPTFMALLGRQYQPGGSTTSNATTHDDPAWTAALNAVLALSQRRRAEQQQPQNRTLADRAWAYAKNALEVLLALLMRSTSLLSVQALLALASFFRGTPNPQPFFFLTAAAVRLSHSAGLHRDHLAPLTPADREQRLRVFWIALVLDAGASFRTGRPCTHSVDDIGVPLPSAAPNDNLGIVVDRRGAAVLSYLRAQARFAVLEGRVYGRIFAACAAAKDTEVLDQDVRELGRELEEWSCMVPGGTTVGCSDGRRRRLEEEWGGQWLHVAGLLLAYHSCVITVHSATWQRHFSSLRSRRCGGARDAAASSASSSFPGAEVCLSAAHEILRLLAHVPRECTSFIWEQVHRPVQAMMLFFVCILQQPDDADAETHLQAIHDAVTFMSRAMTNQEDSFVQPMVTVGHELIRIARAAIQKGRARPDADQPDGSRGMRVDGAQPSPSADAVQFSAVSGLGPGMHQSVLPSTPSRMGDVGQRAEGPTSTPAGQPMSGLGFPDPWSVDSGFAGIDQLSDIPLPFTWNWQDLSTGLLEDFNLF